MAAKFEQQSVDAFARLQKGEDFSEVVRSTFAGDETDMRKFIHDFPFKDLFNIAGRTMREESYAVQIANFLSLVDEFRAAIASRRGKAPRNAIASVHIDQEGYTQLRRSLTLTAEMREKGSPVMAMLIEERIDADIVTELSGSKQRNAVRSLILQSIYNIK